VPERWQECREYLHGLDLFNHGYYWEAHEAWEGLWHARSRTGPTADFLKALIKLAAAGVKVREGRPQGVLYHARRAAELFQSVAATLGGVDTHFMGLSLGDLRRLAEAIATRPPPKPGGDAAQVVIVFDTPLCPAFP
jgi:predicted metal-dependent hydrolase